MEPKVRLAYSEYLALADQARKSKEYERSFAYLEYAHILDQHDVLCHVHLQMLWLALCTADWREMAGQSYRLLLTPFGHLFNRLPLGNTGRSNVSAFEPMTIPEELREILIPVERK
ncbi:MAG: DUF3703 domain-containing protein [Gammaproteobacteria bacterium]|nr:DUF3703 domain-containing protein [Gammaproteobacteria bacterium]